MLDNNGHIINLLVIHLNLKKKITGQIGNNGTKNFKLLVPFKYLSNFWKTLEMPLIICETNLLLTVSPNCFTSPNAASDQETTFAVTDTKIYVPVVALSTQDKAKILQQLKTGIKRIILSNKYSSKVLTQARNQYLDYLIDQLFQEQRNVLCYHLKIMHTK